jgi:Ran GTPase-activating protein (RanGAP) involved in mRNA processing and transport
LKLPQGPLQKGKGRSVSTTKSRPSKAALKKLKDLTKQPAFKQYSIEKINISGYKRKGFDKEGLKELVRGMQYLVRIREIILRENGIGDDCSEEIGELLRNLDIRCLDLSSNNLAKQSAQVMAQTLAETSHLIWLEYFFIT